MPTSRKAETVPPNAFEVHNVAHMQVRTRAWEFILCWCFRLTLHPCVYYLFYSRTNLSAHMRARLPFVSFLTQNRSKIPHVPIMSCRISVWLGSPNVLERWRGGAALAPP